MFLTLKDRANTTHTPHTYSFSSTQTFRFQYCWSSFKCAHSHTHKL